MKRNSSWLMFFGVQASFAMGLFGCGVDVPEPPGRGSEVAVVEGTPKAAGTAPTEDESSYGQPHFPPPSDESLPPDTMSGEGCWCPAEPKRATLCEWAGSVDVLVEGRVVDLRGDTSTIGSLRSGKFVETKTCRLISPALKIDIDVDSWLRGKTGRRATAFVGGSQAAMFQPRPKISEDNRVSWYEMPGSARKGLREGQRILMGLREASYQKLSLMGEAIFGVTDDGVVVARPNSGDCGESVPPELDGMSLAELEMALARCSSEDTLRGAGKKAKRVREWTAIPSRVSAAECNDGDPASVELLRDEPTGEGRVEVVHTLNPDIPEPPPRTGQADE